MSFKEDALSKSRPERINNRILFPRHLNYYPSPVDWREEILYFLLVDRFSDGQENGRPLLNRNNLAAIRQKIGQGKPWKWDLWAKSGADRWQGGNLKGVKSKLDYLKKLGITTIWISPVFKQRGHENSYHGYGIQDFLDVDPRFGDRRDLADLVAAAHQKDMRIILDIIFNHSGCNWLYPPDIKGGSMTPDYTGDRYSFGAWRGDQGQPIDSIRNSEDGVWPEELQKEECYTRAGCGSLAAGEIDKPYAEHKRTDFFALRDFNLTSGDTLDNLASCYKYWIALTDCDGFRIDTLKHVPEGEARNFCGTIKEFAADLGKDNFFMAGEIAGGDDNEKRYLDVLERNLNAALDIGEMRGTLTGVAKGLIAPSAYFDGFSSDNPLVSRMGSHRNLGNKHVSILDDHDHVFGEKVRFSADAASDHQVAAGVAIQLLTLGVPCIYYGTEQSFAGPEPEERKWLPEWRSSDRYLREAMFGPEHPLKDGCLGLYPGPECKDPDLPGFGPFSTAGHHSFDEGSPAFQRIAALTALRQSYPALRHGRQYLRPISTNGGAFNLPGPGEIVAWSRILDDEEVLCIINSHGTEARSANILVDPNLHPSDGTMSEVLNTSRIEGRGRLNVMTDHQVKSTGDAVAYVEVRDLPPSEVLVLTNYPGPQGGTIL